MKRIIAILFLILIIPGIALAVVDDTNFKTYTITPDKMLGTEANTNLEDTPYAQVMTNLYNNGDSIVSFSHGTFLNTSDVYETIFKCSDVNYYYSNMSKPAYSQYIGSLISIASFPFSNIGNGEPYFMNGLYNGAQKTFIACSNGLTLHDYIGKAYISNISPAWWATAMPTTFAIWKKRLFVSGFCNENYRNYFYYSKVGDFSNFTPTQYQGGAVTIQPDCQIFKILAVSYGVYIFTADGIYYLSGGLPETWKLEKISNLILNSDYSGSWLPNDSLPASVIEDKVLFVDKNMDMYVLTNNSASKISHLPYYCSKISNIQLFQNRFFILINRTLSNFEHNFACAYIYDIKNKCWSVWENICRASENSYTAYKITKIYGEMIYYQQTNYHYISNFNNWQQISGYKYQNKVLETDGKYFSLIYQTPWYSLENKSNYKKLKRIEIDVKTYAGLSNTFALTMVTDTTNEATITKTIANLTEPDVCFDTASQTYTFRFINTNEFKKIKLRLETKYSLILSQIRIIYEPVGVK